MWALHLLLLLLLLLHVGSGLAAAAPAAAERCKHHVCSCFCYVSSNCCLVPCHHLMMLHRIPFKCCCHTLTVMLLVPVFMQVMFMMFFSW
jgi:hypothetical protein